MDKHKQTTIESEEAIRAMVKEVVRAYRDTNPLSSNHRPFLTELSWFLVQATSLQLSLATAKVDFLKDIPSRCVKLMMLKDCPAVETIQLQVSIHAHMFLQQKKLTEEDIQYSDMQNDILKNLLNIRTIDRREIYAVSEKFHQLVVDFVKETSKRIDEDLQSIEVNEHEIQSAVNSVFPRTGFLCWLEMSDLEKISQLQELSVIVPGIRAYNRSRGKGSSFCPKIFNIFEKEADIVRKKTIDESRSISDRVASLLKFINSHSDTLGINHVLYQRLRDEVHYDLQLLSFLMDLQTVLSEMFLEMRNLHESFLRQLDVLTTTIGSEACVPNELVFPEFRNIGLIQKRASNELRKFRAQSIVAKELFMLCDQPKFKRTPIGMASVTTKQGIRKLELLEDYCGFLPPHVYMTNFSEVKPKMATLGKPSKLQEKITLLKDLNNPLLECLKLQLNGYCLVNVVHTGGLLLPGDTKKGIAQVGANRFAFSKEEYVHEFMKEPENFLALLNMMAIAMPQLVNLLDLQKETTFTCLSIPYIMELVCKEPLRSECASQTATHIQPEHLFDEETLYNRCLQLSNKKTHGTQTVLSHFHRDSSTQVWLPREKTTQTLFCKGTSFPKKLRFFENLRGPPTFQFNVMEVTFEV